MADSEFETQDINKRLKENLEDSDEEYFSLDEDEMEQLNLKDLGSENKDELKSDSPDKSDNNADCAQNFKNVQQDNVISTDNHNEKDNDSDSDNERQINNDDDIENLVNDNGDDDEIDKDNEIKEEEYRRSVEETLSDDEKLERKDKAQVLKDDGNKLFREGNYAEAIQQYTEALKICPYSFPKERSIMFSNRGACHMKQENNEEAIKDCSNAIDLHPHYIKAILRRAELYEKTEKLDEALSDYTKAVEIDPNQTKARITAMRLTDEIKDRNEKMKAEMMGKLKDLGNLVLKPFGLSTENFQLQQNPDTGSYSVNFKQN